MKKEYTYTRALEFDFDSIIEANGLDKNSDFWDCKTAVNEYCEGLDDVDYYVIDNERQIAKDLYDYLQSK